jgi:sulfate adenylyltransferase subunit 1
MTHQSTMLRLATAGSVDDGKSTLVGRLLHDTKSILADQLDAVERASRDRGWTGADLALLTDGLRAEREQGITIDVAYRYFATDAAVVRARRHPGHVQYTRNMVTGASTADVVDPPRRRAQRRRRADPPPPGRHAALLRRAARDPGGQQDRPRRRRR